MQDFCERNGFKQLTTEPTREKHLLDLVLTDCPSIVKVKVVDGVSDHRGVFLELSVCPPIPIPVERRVWDFGKADWDGLKAELRDCNLDWVPQVFPRKTSRKRF